MNRANLVVTAAQYGVFPALHAVGPLGDIAVHIVKPPSVGFEFSRRGGCRQSCPSQRVGDGGKGASVTVSRKIVPVVVTRLGAGPTGVFPFDLGREIGGVSKF